jgi:glycosyltransferase involved in cell wall biosynthesis
VIATRDRAESLQAALDRLRELDTCGITWELVVADNGSLDARG